MMSDNETVFNSLKGNTQDAMDKIADAILLLRSFGLEPTGFTMDADTLYHLSGRVYQETLLNRFWDGGINLEEALSKYDFSIMGIPIEPDYSGRVIKARRKDND